MLVTSSVMRGSQAQAVYNELADKVLTASRGKHADVERKPRHLAVVRRAKGLFGKIIGGAYGFVFPGWLYVDLLWVDPMQRKRKIATEMLAQLEDEAAALGAHHAYLYTQDFEAPAFYIKQGYEEYARFDNFIPGSQRIAFRKPLINEVSA